MDTSDPVIEGRLSDIIGRKAAMLTALSLFGMLRVFPFRLCGCDVKTSLGSGTICCGLASSMELLIVARAVAGMGGGG